MKNPFNLSDEKLKELITGYEAWLKSDPKEGRYPDEIREKSKKIKEEFLNTEVLPKMSDDELYDKIYKYSRKLEGPVHIRLGEPRLKACLSDIRRNLMYIMTSEDTPFLVAQNILEGKYKISIFAKAFWSPILLAQFPDKLPNWNNKTENFLKKFGIKISTSKMTISEKYKIISDVFTYLSGLIDGQDFYTINHLMHYGTVIKEGKELIEKLSGVKTEDPVAEMIKTYKTTLKQKGLEDELYKWELLRKFRGRPDTNAIDFASEIKSINFSNIIYPMAGAVKNHIAKERPEELRKCFTRLFFEQEDITKRISDFIKDTLEVYRKLEPELGHYQDERTVAAYLTYHDPENFTFYKDSYYQKYCKLISVEPKPTGEKYAHYLEILADMINEYILPDKELLEIVKSSLNPDCIEDKNQLLLAQDILYQTLEKKDSQNQFVEEAELVDRLRAIGSRQMVEDHFIMLGRSVNLLNLTNDDPRISFSVRSSDNLLAATINQRYIIASEVSEKGSFGTATRITWLLIPSSYNDKLQELQGFIRKSDKGGFKAFSGEKDPPLWVVFDQRRLIADDSITDIWLSGVRVELERASVSGFRKHHNSAYFKAVTDLSYRIKILDMAFGEKTKAMNLILYGPPGTGKTYQTIDYAVKISAPERFREGEHEKNKIIYEELMREGQIVFTTFHQSMCYEDFIEGIKPASDESSNLTYSVEDGLFKQLAINAAFEFVGEKSPDASKSLSFSTVYDQLIDDVNEKIGNNVGFTLKLRSGAELEVVEITSASNFIVQHKNGSRTYTVSRKRLEKLFSDLPDLDDISNINEEIRNVIGGSNASAYWAVLKKLRSYIGEIQPSGTGKKYSYDDKAAAVEKLLPEDVIVTGNEKRYVLIIDEINRGNVSQVFGELITLIEEDKRFGKKERLSAKLPYSRSRFFVPPNMYIVGTMNTADRSVEALDTALRRRFSFIEMVPLYDLEGMGKVIADISLSELLETINGRIEKLIDRDHRIGHSYFLGIDSTDDLMKVFKYKIIPLLQEYFYGNYEKMGLVLGSGFIDKLPDEKVTFARFPADEHDFNDKVIYRICKKPLEDAEEFENALDLLMNNQ
jgi:5-methylcytosine-specific restriction endonuclease McrBC GTP-binding regulatory subunit McrB